MLSAPYPWRTAGEALLGIKLKRHDSNLGMVDRAVKGYPSAPRHKQVWILHLLVFKTKTNSVCEVKKIFKQKHDISLKSKINIIYKNLYHIYQCSYHLFISVWINLSALDNGNQSNFKVKSGGNRFWKAL